MPNERERAVKRELDEIVLALRRELPEIKRRYGVRSLAVFGSRVRGEHGAGSDLDILVEYDKAPTLFKFIELEDHLSQTLNAKVDLVMRSALRPRLGERILAERVIV